MKDLKDQIIYLKAESAAKSSTIISLFKQLDESRVLKYECLSSTPSRNTICTKIETSHTNLYASKDKGRGEISRSDDSPNASISKLFCEVIKTPSPPSPPPAVSPSIPPQPPAKPMRPEQPPPPSRSPPPPPIPLRPSISPQVRKKESVAERKYGLLPEIKEKHEWNGGTCLIIGYSMIGGVDPRRMGGKYKVRSHPGAEINDIFYHVTPLLKKKPASIIIVQ